MLEQSVTAIAPRGRRRWDRSVTVNFMAQAEVGRRVGQSQVKLAAQLGVPRNTLRYWQARKANLEGSPKVALLDEQDQLVYQKRLPNALNVILEELSPYQPFIEGLVVESTYNWYWLVDGLQAAGYRLHLANTAAIQQYTGLKHTDDRFDARWLAHLLRLGILPEGYIYPREERAVRDLLRKRGQLVRHRTTHLLSIQNLILRNTSVRLSSNRIKHLTLTEVDELLPNPQWARAVKSNLMVMNCLAGQIELLEQEGKAEAKLKPMFQALLTVTGDWNHLGADHRAGNR